LIIKPEFDFANWNFPDGLALVIKGKKMAYIDKTGKYIWKEE